MRVQCEPDVAHLEQVLGKRRKVVVDMCEQLAAKAQLVAQSEEWILLHGSDKAATGAPLAVQTFLKERLMSLADEEEEYYNENTTLGDAIQEAAAVAAILTEWPQGL